MPRGAARRSAIPESPRAGIAGQLRRISFSARASPSADVKVLLSSGYSADAGAAQLLSEGCAGFIQKPFSLEELLQKLCDILGSRQ